MFDVGGDSSEQEEGRKGVRGFVLRGLVWGGDRVVHWTVRYGGQVKKEGKRGRLGEIPNDAKDKIAWTCGMRDTEPCRSAVNARHKERK